MGNQNGQAFFVAMVVVVVFGAGCTPAVQTPLGPLPTHRLDLTARPGRVEPVKRKPLQTPQAGQWAAKGYRPWRYIVIHHSATDRGSAALFDAAHRRRGWEGLGYHFVIDNGRGGPDGRIEVGPRWLIQKWGAHCGGTPNNEYNNYGIGICVVGNFCDHLPSRAQLDSLKRLVMYLVQTYHISPANVIGHRDAPNAHTKCPGEKLHKYLNEQLRPELVRASAS